MVHVDFGFKCFLSPRRHMDTSLIDVDVQPTYARVSVKGKVCCQAFISQISQQSLGLGHNSERSNKLYESRI